MLVVTLTAGQAMAQSKDELFKQIFGKRAAVDKQIDAVLVVDGVDREPVSIRTSGRQLLSVDVLSLKQNLQTLIDAETATCLDRIASLPMTHLQECGISVLFDPATLKLVATVPTARRREQIIAIQPGGPRRDVTVGEARHSAYLNLSASARQRSERRVSEQDVGLGFDGAIRAHGATLEFDGVCTDSTCMTGLTSLVFDQPNALRRWRMGDLPDARAGGIVLPGLTGIAVGTAFELAPAMAYAPDLDTPMELDSTSTVEVFVNERSVQRLQLPPGRYSLRDFPLAFGANAARLEITDAAGRVQTRDLAAFVDLSLLDLGRSRYGFAIAQPRIAIQDEARLLYPWTVTAEYARGIGPATTAGISGAAMPELNRQMVELFLTRGVGRWLVGTRLRCAAGTANGCLADVQFRSSDGPNQSHPGWRLEGSLSAQQSGFSELIGSPTNVWRAQMQLRAGRSLGDRHALSVGLRLGRSESQPSDAEWSAQFGGRPSRQLSYRLGLEHYRGGSQPADTRITASITWLFDSNQQSARWAMDSRDHLQSVGWQLNRGGLHGGYDAFLEETISDLGRTLNASAGLRHERLGMDASYNNSRNDSDPAVQDLRLTARTAFVYADGAFGLTEQVSGAFGMVQPTDAAGAGTVYVNVVDDDYLASSRGPGPAVVANLRPYEARALVVSLPELAANHDPGPLFPVVQPGYKGGVLIPAGGAPTVSVVTTVLKANGMPLEMCPGQLVAETGGEPIPVFAGRGGRLRVNGLTAGVWTLTLNTTPKRIHRFVIPEQQSGLLELGELKP